MDHRLMEIGKGEKKCLSSNESLLVTAENRRLTMDKFYARKKARLPEDVETIFFKGLKH
jgi:hypothetical protein